MQTICNRWHYGLWYRGLRRWGSFVRFSRDSVVNTWNELGLAANGMAICP